MSSRNAIAEIRRIAEIALLNADTLLRRLLPGGKLQGVEYVALNPTRQDRSLGSFRINPKTGRWADFAVRGASGGDLVSLYAYLKGLKQGEAAREVARILGVRHD